MSQTKRKVKIRQHIAQLHIKTQAVNCPNFKWQKAEPETKRPSLSDERFANWCVDSFEDQKDRYHAFVGEQSRWIDILESRLRVSEAEHQAKIKEMQEEFNSYCAKTQANCNHCAVKHTEKIEVLEGENAKLKIEVEQLKAVRDALGRSNKNALADRNKFIKKAEVLEGRLEDYGKCLWKAVQGDFEFLWKEYGEEDDSKLTEDAKKLKQMLHTVVRKVGVARLSELQAIKAHYEKMPKENQSIYWTSICDDEIQDEFIGQKFFTDLQKWYQELGVLLSEPTFLPKKLDQKTEYEKCKFNPKDDCNDCEFEGCPNWGASLEEQDIEKSEPKELDQKTREGDPK